MALTAQPTFTFNASTGSDTAASGAGPGTALAGTAAAVTNTSASVTIADAVDLSGVAQDGSAVLWVVTASGRQFSRISVVAGSSGAWTLTVEDLTWTTGTGLTWAIGGKRATWDNTASRRALVTDVKAGWTILTETDQTVSAVLSGTSVGDTTAGPVTYAGSGGLRTITQTANASTFSFAGTGSRIVYRDLKLANSNGTKSSARGIQPTAGQHTVLRCTLGDSTNTFLSGVVASGSAVVVMVDCDVTACTSHGGDVTSNGEIVVIGCAVHGNGGGGINLANNGRVVVRDSLIYGNTGDGIFKSGGVAALTQITGNTIHGNGGDGIDLATAAADSVGLVLVNNNLTGNTGYGLRGNALTDAMKALVDFNNFGTGGTANTAGARLDVSAGANDLAVDPGYADASSGDFAPGTAIKAEGFPDAARTVGNDASGTTAFVDIGGAQREEAGGGSTTSVDPGIANVRDGTEYMIEDVALEGTMTLPAVGDVELGVDFGGSGTEFTGTFAVPAEGFVQDGVDYGAGGTEFTGTLGTTGITLGDLQAELDARNATAARLGTLPTAGTVANTGNADTFKADVSGLSTFDPITDTVTVGTVNDKSGYTLLQDFPANFDLLAITGAGEVDAGTTGGATAEEIADELESRYVKTLVAGGTGTIRLAADESTSGLENWLLWTVDGTGAGQLLRITGHAGADVTAVDAITGDAPAATDDDTTYQLIAPGYATNAGGEGSGLDAAGVRSALGMASANLDTQLGGIAAKTTNLPASFPANFASLGINASGHVSRVVLVDTTTTNTDMRGTNGANTTTPPTVAAIRAEIDANSAKLDDVWAAAGHHRVEKVATSATAGEIRVYEADGTTVRYTRPYTLDGDDQDVGAAT